MNKDDKKQFLKTLLGVAELYGKALSENVILLYWDILKQYELNDVCNSFTQYASGADTGQFMPKPADIIKVIDGTGESRSLAAWSKVEKAIRSVGSYETVVFDDPRIHRVIEDMGGWVLLNTILNKELPFKMNEFNKRYLSYSMKKEFDYPKKLAGIAEASNSTEDYNIPNPVFIGSEAAAIRVLSQGQESKSQITRMSDLTNLALQKLKES